MFIIKAILYPLLMLNGHSLQKNEPSEPFNYFQFLPPEIKWHIASFLIKETDAQLLKHLQEELIFDDDINYQKTTKYILHITSEGNLRVLDEINNKFAQLTNLNSSWFNIYPPEYQDRIMRFAISPNKKRIVALQSRCRMLGNFEIEHQKIWAFTLKPDKTITHSARIPTLFDARTEEADSHPKIQQLLQKGYRCQGYSGPSGDWLLTKFFYHLAISNNGLIALADSNTVFSLDLETTEHKCLQKLPWHKKLNCRSLINTLEFNTQGTKLAVQYKDFTTTNDEISYTTKEIILPTGQPEPECDLYSYFEKRGICKPKQLEQQ